MLLVNVANIWIFEALFKRWTDIDAHANNIHRFATNIIRMRAKVANMEDLALEFCIRDNSRGSLSMARIVDFQILRVQDFRVVEVTTMYVSVTEAVQILYICTLLNLTKPVSNKPVLQIF